MSSRFSIPIELFNTTTTPDSSNTGFIALYFKNNNLTQVDSNGQEKDVVLDRVLDGFVPAVNSTPIVNTDNVLDAFNKIQAQINNISISGTDKYFVYEQNVPSDTWYITHNLYKTPSVSVIDSFGTYIEGEIQYISATEIILLFSGGFSGKAYLN